MDERIEKMVLDVVEQNNVQKQQFSELLAAMRQIPQLGGEIRAVVQPPLQDAEAVRADKVQCLTLALRKSNKIRDFKDVLESDIREWVKKFDFEIAALKRMVGINNDLTREEYIPLLRDKLDYSIVKRLDSIFKQRNPALEWGNVSKDNLHKCLIEEF